MKSAAELAEGNAQVNFLLAAKEKGDTGGLKMSQVIVANAFSDEQHNVIAIHFVLLEAQHAFGIRADCQPFGILVGDVVATRDRLISARQFVVSAAKGFRPSSPGAF